MNEEDLQDRYDAARAAILAAGDLAMEFHHRLSDIEVRSKGLQDVVTEADLALEQHFKAALLNTFPADDFFGEEGGLTNDTPARGLWVVDPIDGTQPFVSGLRDWCISLAFVSSGILQFGLVLAPGAGELFEGGVGRPATLNGRPIKPHPGASVSEGIVAVGYSPRIGPDDILPVLERLLRRGGTYYRSGSGALCLCYVACGRLLGYIEPHINSYDCLGGIAVTLAAGGRANDFLAGEGLVRGNRIVVSAAAVFEELDDILGPGRSTEG